MNRSNLKLLAAFLMAIFSCQAYGIGGVAVDEAEIAWDQEDRNYLIACVL
jgi:hypothetical protein